VIVTARETKSANELATERTDLALSRTLMAADRTLMAWIRTAFSMISFGFTIYRLLEGLRTSGTALPNAGSPRTVGLFLIGLGVVSMLIGSFEHSQALKELRHTRRWRPASAIAWVISITGLCLFGGILSRVL
jgi:putative membrane protein